MTYWRCTMGHLHTTWCPLTGQIDTLDPETHPDTLWQVELVLETAKLPRLHAHIPRDEEETP